MGTDTLFAMDRPECVAGLEGPSVLQRGRHLLPPSLSASNKSEETVICRTALPYLQVVATQSPLP